MIPEYAGIFLFLFCALAGQGKCYDVENKGEAMRVLLLVIILLVAIRMPMVGATQDDPIGEASKIVNAYGHITIQNANETRTVWDDGTLKITKRVFTDGRTVLAIRWYGQLVARHLMPPGWVTVCLDGEWQAYIERIASNG